MNWKFALHLNSSWSLLFIWLLGSFCYRMRQQATKWYHSSNMRPPFSSAVFVCIDDSRLPVGMWHTHTRYHEFSVASLDHAWRHWNVISANWCCQMENNDLEHNQFFCEQIMSSQCKLGRRCRFHAWYLVFRGSKTKFIVYCLMELVKCGTYLKGGSGYVLSFTLVVAKRYDITEFYLPVNL